MASKPLEKVAHLRIVEFLDDEQHFPNMLLSDLLAEAKAKYPANNLPFSYGNSLECIVVSHRKDNEFQFIHLVTFEKGANAAVINNFGALKPKLVDEVEPPQNNEFIKSQLFLICGNNHISWVSHNSSLRPGTVSSLIGNLLNEFHPNKNLPKFFLTAPIDQKAFKVLMDEGIRSIELKTTAVRQQLEYLKAGGQVRGTLLGFLKSDEITEEDLEASTKLRQSVTLLPGHAWDSSNMRVVLEKISKGLINDISDDEGFVIVTKQGHKLTKDSMTITSKINTEGNSQKLDTDETFNSLKSAFRNMIKIAD